MPEVQSGQMNELLRRWVQGDEKALGIFAPLAYQELQRLAHYHLKSERADHTLQSTALVTSSRLLRAPCVNFWWTMPVVVERASATRGLGSSSMILMICR